MDAVLVVGVLAAMVAVLLQGGPVLACRCEGGSDLPPDTDNSLQWPNSGPRDAGTTSGLTTSGSALDEVLTPALVRAYLALQLQRVAMDMAEKSRAFGADCSSASGRCGVAPASRRRSKRFTSAATAGDSVPVFAGLAGLSAMPAMPSASALVDLRGGGGGGVRSKQTTRGNDESNDVPVFKGSNEGSPLARVVTPAPRPVAAPRLAPGSAAASRTTTAPSVPVVKGSADPAHPTTPRIPDGLQLSPEEEKALAVLLAARPRAPPRPSARPLAPLPTPVTRVSGKVGGKAVPAVPVAVPTTRRKDECCGQRKLLQELERQLAILRQLNDDHLRADELSRAASYPSPYYPYLHNLPIHPSRGYEDAAPALLPTYFLSAADWRRGRPAALFPTAVGSQGSPPTPWGGGRGVAAVVPQTPAAHLPAAGDCDWSASDVGGDAADGGHLDDKVHFSEQRKAPEEAEDLRGADPADDVGVDAKLSEPVDVEIR